MGKQKVPVKQNEHSTTKPTHVFEQGLVSKAGRTIPYKRLKMLQRRVYSLISEKNTWEEKNKGLSDALKTEKLLTASLKKESFHWQRLYHESQISNNTYKMKQIEMAQSLSTCLRNIDSVYPHLVALTESVTSTKIQITNLLNTLPSTDYNCLTKRFTEGGEINTDNRKNEKPMKQKVGPMVKGHQIVTKPTIMIERLMLPQTQDQIINGDNVDDISPISNNPLPPIAEEDESPCFRHIPVRLKHRKKLGTSWRQRRQENVKNDVSRERDKDNPVPVSFNEESSDSEDIPAVLQHMKEPCLTNIGHLIKGPSSSMVDSSCGGGEERRNLQSAVGHFSMRPDDPMEGSSWMYSNYHHPFHSNERRSSIYKSDSSDDEDALIVQKKAPNMSTMNTLLMNTESFNNSMTKKIESKSESSSHNTSSDCTAEVPDSTNNVQSLSNNNFSFKASKSPCSPTSTSSPCTSTDNGTAKDKTKHQLSYSGNRLSVCLSKVPSSTPRSSNNCSNRYSDFCNSPEESHVTSRKRIRKSNNHRYPTEDYILSTKHQNNNCKPSKLASLTNSSKNKNDNSRCLKNRPSSGSSNIIEDAKNACVGNKEISKDNTHESSRQTKRSKSKTRPSKKSTYSPKPSIKNRSQLLQDSGSEDRPTRRNRSNVCYKESPLNTKKRRP